MFYNARYYSPLLSRFISADSIVAGAGDAQALNRFSYVLGNPLKYIDPSGHATCGGTSLEIGSGISEADCNAVQALRAGNYDDPTVAALLEKLWKLMLTSPSAAKLVAALNAKGVEIGYSIGFEDKQWFDLITRWDGTAATVVAGLAGTWDIFLNADVFVDEVSKIGSSTEPGARFGSFETVMAGWAARIAHELFHIAIGDTQGAPSNGDNILGGPAYRFEGKVLNEILYNGNRANYEAGSILTRSTNRGGWNYYQINYRNNNFINKVRSSNADPRVGWTIIRDALTINYFETRPR
jgi:hypothetical protein